jgi:hypothetical protein
MTAELKQYLGDAVYCGFDGYHIILTTEDGICTQNKIFLEPKVLKCLIDYCINVGIYVQK